MRHDELVETIGFVPASIREVSAVRRDVDANVIAGGRHVADPIDRSKDVVLRRTLVVQLLDVCGRKTEALGQHASHVSGVLNAAVKRRYVRSRIRVNSNAKCTFGHGSPSRIASVTIVERWPEFERRWSPSVGALAERCVNVRDEPFVQGCSHACPGWPGAADGPPEDHDAAIRWCVGKYTLSDRRRGLGRHAPTETGKNLASRMLLAPSCILIKPCGSDGRKPVHFQLMIRASCRALWHDEC